MEEELPCTEMGPPPHQETGNSFTALLELPPNQAMELLTYDPSAAAGVTSETLKRHRISAYNHTLHSFPTHSSPSNRVKPEPVDTGSCPGSSDPNNAGSDVEKPILKRKDTGKKGKNSKKSKTTSEDAEKLPYVHVRARRGEATDSHSLAERARREKINARMKLLQELVPGCNKISGTALVLEEIINHVQYLQRQVEYLSMRLAAVNPRVDFNLDSLISAGHESVMECNFPDVAMPLMWPDIQMNGDRQPFQHEWHFESLNQPVWIKEEGNRNLVTPENSILSYDSSANSVSLHSSQLKMGL